MDSDDRVDSFHTTNATEYSPKPLSKSLPIENPMKSFVPQGDPSKERIPLSDYMENFLGIDTNKFKIHKAPCMHTGKLYLYLKSITDDTGSKICWNMDMVLQILRKMYFENKTYRAYYTI